MTKFSDAAWKDMHPAMWYARGEARRLHVAMTGKDLVITSGRRPQSPGGSSLHPEGKAMDLRTWYLPDVHTFANELQATLGEDFFVLVEGPEALQARYRDRPAHVHVDYRPRGRHADG